MLWGILYLIFTDCSALGIFKCFTHTNLLGILFVILGKTINSNSNIWYVYVYYETQINDYITARFCWVYLTNFRCTEIKFQF